MPEHEAAAAAPNLSPSQDSISAISALAVMYSHTAGVPTATEILFRAGDKNESFVRADIAPESEGNRFRDQASVSLQAMFKLGLLAQTGRAHAGRSHYYRTTPKLARVTSNYNALYSELLKESTGFTHKYIQEHSLATLGGAFFGNNAPVNPLVRASVIANINPEHARHRALRAFATLVGHEAKVSRIIEDRVRAHPLSKGGKRLEEARKLRGE